MMVILTFYRNFLWLVNIVSLTGCFFISVYGHWSFIVVVFWVKVFTNLTSGTYVHIFHPDQYPFYQHLGFSIWQLYVITFLVDMLLWVMMSLATIFFLS